MTFVTKTTGYMSLISIIIETLILVSFTLPYVDDRADTINIPDPQPYPFLYAQPQA